MVYRGKPSAGCETCRKAKKKCTLELPACSRCVKLNKQCSGYRDTTGLQIQDETLSVTRKAEKKNAQPSAVFISAPSKPKPRTAIGEASSRAIPQAPFVISKHDASSFLSTTTCFTPPDSPPEFLSGSSSSSEDTIDYPLEDYVRDAVVTRFGWNDTRDLYVNPHTGIEMKSIPRNPGPKLDDIAMSYFLSYFTATDHWNYLVKHAARPKLDPCLTSAIKACGMAALENVRYIPRGREWSRNAYMKAITLLNETLQDPVGSKKDESLMAVNMLSFFENLVCDSKQSILSWKAHIAGATQLLKMRGKAQLKTPIGRGLFRETRAQIIVYCIWDDLEPPSFLVDWTDALQTDDPDLDLIRPADDFSDICYDFAKIENRMKLNKISDEDALIAVNDIDTRLVQWSIDTMANQDSWRYYDLQVDDSPHVWNGMVHAYSGLPCPGVWNTFRGVRIMVTRAQEHLTTRFSPTAAARQSQHAYFRAVRRKLTDEICATIPVALGHAQPAFSSSCVLVSAYNSIWPLFFAGTCILERIGRSAGKNIHQSNSTSSAAMAQLAWILERFDYISKELGLRWADGVAATLRGDFKIHDDILPSPSPQEMATESPVLQRLLVDEPSKPQWILDIEKSGGGPRVMIEGDRRLPKGPGGLMTDLKGPNWLGRHVEEEIEPQVGQPGHSHDTTLPPS